MKDLHEVTVVMVPGLREETPAHWQPLLAGELPNVRSLPAQGRTNIDLDARVAAIDAAVLTAPVPVIVVAHSGGCIATAHWARRTGRKILGALLATPPDLAQPLPPEFPALSAFAEAGWTPVPKEPLPFRCIVAASRNDPLGEFARVTEMASGWGAELVDLGEVGHLNPASGYGLWPAACALIRSLAQGRAVPGALA
ncbi:serine hydrolase family protein (plasmid) [Cupriavidus necator]|uniref:Serine hydrolase family protein n=1 Tax=Cupriavidus necator TaxID=106590 RepID=A0A367PCA0_CUPNE|nr:alpha/beta hydrolase [Cupriavidus necator]QQX89138.1 serine hydrolase family protein [Cupriavidus necator]RCJ04656.1 serine hydrolase family protein [Cupriavidus necator]